MRRSFIIGTPLQRTAVSAHFQALARELARRGHQATILAPPGECEHDLSDKTFSVYSWPSKRPTKFPDAVMLSRLILRHRPDCLVANFASVNWMCLVGWAAGIRCRIAWYHTLSAQNDFDSSLPPQRMRFLRKRKRLVYRAATHLAANSRASVEDAFVTFGVPRIKCKVWRNSLRDPCHDTALPPWEESGTNRETTLLCVGRFDHSKGQDVLIEALGLCRDSLGAAKIEFLGEGPTLASLRSRVAELGLASFCIFRGYVPHQTVLQRMTQARFTIVPSRREAFGLVNIESMAVGTPVLASGVDGICDIVRDGLDGFLVPAGHPGALAARLVELLKNPSLCSELGRNARARFIEHYEQAKVVAAQADWLEEICQR